MKLAIMQPYLFPYIGYFQLIKAVDTFVIYDDVNFIRRGWINRNRILCNGKASWLSLELQKASPNKLINQIQCGDNQKRMLKTIQFCYGKAPYFKDVYPLLERILLNQNKNLAKFVGESIRETCKFMGMKKEFKYSSDIHHGSELKGQFKIIGICSALGAKQYINPIAGKELYDFRNFQEKQIQLSFLQFGEVSYKQFSETFVPTLSIIDILMFNSKNEINELLNNYRLV